MRLWAEDGLVFSCDCPLGSDGEFCKHCVAAGLAWLEGDFSEDAPGASATMDDVQTYLEELDKDLLVRIVMQQAMEDERLRERLLLNRKNNKAYRKAYELLLKVRTLMRRLGREAEFEEYVELLRLEYKRKRNFMKLLDGMG